MAATQVFKSEDVELPRNEVADYLEDMNPNLCALYLEYLIEEREEDSQEFHDRIAELYAKMTIASRKRGDESECESLQVDYVYSSTEPQSLARGYTISCCDLSTRPTSIK